MAGFNASAMKTKISCPGIAIAMSNLAIGAYGAVYKEEKLSDIVLGKFLC